MEMGVISLPTGHPPNYKYPGDTLHSFWAGYLNDVIVSIGQIVAFLENHLGVPIKVTSSLLEEIYKKLRATIRQIPKNEKEIQDAIENLLIISEYDYKREQITIPYSTKYFTPDFTFDTLSTAMDVKFCNSQSDEKKIIDEINSDIPAYKSKYNYAVFVVYDMGYIRDTLAFAKGFEMNNPNVYVAVVKH